MRCMHAPRTRTKERGILVCSSWSSGVCRGPGLIWYVHHWWVLCCWHIDRMHGRQIEFCPEPARVSTGAEWSAPVFLVTCFFSLFALEFLSSGLTRRQSVAWLELITTHPRGTHFWGWKKIRSGQAGVFWHFGTDLIECFCLVDWTDLEMVFALGPGGIDEIINLSLKLLESGYKFRRIIPT